ncbi:MULTISPECIES: LamG-like jellyroll fold domain-containing protein [unclassified Paraburkholderia]|uniref:LamG-like jellyroll fold domain-containing protein n=1 Tax=unclassified Paraburkholderia TaxID=2615204 RepID=UPI002AB0EF56|nr:MULTISPECIES: LamG-like jellyroll fold domain-containing protein [unclassified Paraburkholderia]
MTRQATAQTAVQALCGLVLAGALAGCGGDAAQSPGTQVNSSTANSATSNNSSTTTTPVNKMLVIELDGVTYNALTTAIAAGKLPNLARLKIAPAYSGGVNSTLSQQPNLDTPGWATLVTGTWADRHQINSDASGQALHAPTVFSMLKSAGAGTLGAAVDSPGYAAILAPEQNAGFLDSVVNCASVDSCVTKQGVSMIDNGYTLVVAQYHSAQDAALNWGVNSTNYASTLAQLDSAVGTLIAETAQRSNENWLVMVSASHGLNAAGGTDGLPLAPESTSFIGMNVQSNGRQGSSAAPTSLADLYTRASIADIAPTLLAWRGALPAAASYALDGGELTGQQPVSQLLGVTGSDNASTVLTWTAPSSGAITVLRDGQQIAALPAGTTTYTDSNLGVSTTGAYTFNYTVAAGTAPAASLIRVAYVAPPPPPAPPPALATTLTNGLATYYPFGALPAIDKMGASTLAAWASDADGGALTTDTFGGKGLKIDTSIVDTNGFDGYRLQQTNDVTKQAQFTLGFWFMTSCQNLTGNGTPILSNKNYYSGGNAGIAIGLFPGSSTSCNVRFNIGDGSTRNDMNSATVTANKWAYVALTIDTTGKTMTGYVFDPVLGEQKYSTSVTANVAKLPGLGSFGLNEDGTGQYYMNACKDTAPYTAGKCAATPPDVQSFGDLAFWSRTVTEAELQTVYGSGKPLSTLLP